MPNTLLWIGQALLATIFALAGATKLLVPRERLQVRMHWARTWPRARIRLLGLAELAGALGLVLPRATGLLPLLTPIAAVCLALLMVGAVRTHASLGESPAPAAVVGLLVLVLGAALVVTGAAA